MSYCRFSSMDFRCDVYCYADTGGGYTTITAGSRLKEGIEHKLLPPWPKRPRSAPEMLTPEEAAQFNSRWAEVDAIREACYEPIESLYANKSFRDWNLTDFRARLVKLREGGFVMPDSVFNRIDKEIKEQGAQS